MNLEREDFFFENCLNYYAFITGKQFQIFLKEKRLVISLFSALRPL